MWLLTLVGLVAIAPEAQVQTLSGQTVVGRPTSLSEEALVLSTADGERSFSVKELLGITFPATARAGETPSAWITLVDQSRLAARSYTVKGADAQLALVGGGSVEISTRAINSVRFREHTGALADQWAEIAKADRSGDLLVVRKNDTLDFLSGVVRDVADDVVQFELDGEVLRVKRQKVDGILYQDSRDKQGIAAQCTLRDAAGSELHVASLVIDGERLRARTTAGVEIVRPLAAWSRIDFSQGNLQYLGDLKPESVEWNPYLGGAAASPAARGFFLPHVDKSLEGGPLRLGGREYTKGLAIHSKTELLYRLPEKYHTFAATAGIDDRLRPAGNVRLTIMGDERTLFDDTLSGEDPPRGIELDVSGVNRLKLIVDFGDDMDVGNALDLCEARLSK